MKKNQLQIEENAEKLAEAFAAHFIRLAEEAVRERGRFLVVLSGGGTPLKAYRLLAETSRRQIVPWQQIYLFWGDERYVPQDDAQSNFRQAYEVLLSHIDIPPGNIHPIPTNLPPAAAARAYAETLRSFAEAGQICARFDLVVLGLGHDGHTASLFPGQSARWDQLVITAEGSYDGRPSTRITLTPPAFNLAREVVFLVSGATKAEALHAARGEIRDVNRFPSQAIKPADGRVLWMVDKAAA
ncbi:MAG: 6-phosphogluconolactonase [Anaerolineales bacterium]|nr:6-phosphogluconolactonase [Anaerolineales bacterium]